MTVYLLEAFNTDRRYPDDVRHREYTSSLQRAEDFNQIPRIQFSDSGHGIVFSASQHAGRRKPVVSMEYVRHELAIIEARRKCPVAVHALEKKIKDQQDVTDYWRAQAKSKDELISALQTQLASAQRVVDGY